MKFFKTEKGFIVLMISFFVGVFLTLVGLILLMTRVPIGAGIMLLFGLAPLFLCVFIFLMEFTQITREKNKKEEEKERRKKKNTQQKEDPRNHDKRFKF